MYNIRLCSLLSPDTNNSIYIQPSMQQSLLITLHVSALMDHLQVFSVTYQLLLIVAYTVEYMYHYCSYLRNRMQTIKIFKKSLLKVTKSWNSYSFSPGSLSYFVVP
jgi:hypothetical protein